MKIEITHDIIAKKIFEKGSEEDKLFSRSSRLIKERFVAYDDTNTYLTDRELEFIEPQLEALKATLPKDEFDFVRKSERQKKYRFQKKLGTAALIGIIFGVIVLYLSMYYNDKLAVWVGISSETEKLVSQALQTMDRNPTEALLLAQKALDKDADNESAKQVIYLLHRDNIFYKNILDKEVFAKGMAFSPDNKFVAYAGEDEVLIRNINDPSMSKIFDKGNNKVLHTGIVNDLVFESEDVLLSVSDDNTIKRWRWRSNGSEEVIHTNRNTKDSSDADIDINAIDITPDGRYILVGRGGEGSDCLLIDTENDTTYVIDDMRGRVHDVIFTTPDPDADLPILRKQLIIAVGDDKRIFVYDLETRKLLAQSDRELHPRYIYSVAMNPNSGEIVTACNNDVIRVFSLVENDNPKVSTPYAIKRMNRLTEHSETVRSVRFSKDGLQMVSTSSDRTAIIWDTKRWEPLYTLKGHTGRVYKAEFSNDGCYIATCGEDKKVMVWNLSLKKPTTLEETHKRRVSALAHSGNGQRIYSGTWGNEKTPKRTLITWDTKTWKPIRVDSFSSDIEAISTFHQDSVVVAVGKFLYLIDNKNDTRSIIGTAKGTIKTVVISPNNKFIAFAGRDDKVRFIPINVKKSSSEYKRLKKILTIRREQTEDQSLRDIYSLAISPDNKYLVIGRRNRTLVLWDIEKEGIKQLRPPMNAHDSLYLRDNEVYSISFVTNEQFITTGRDNTIRLWGINRETNEIDSIHATQAHAGGIRCLSVHPNKKMYASGGGDKHVKLWGMDGKLIQVIDAYYNDTERCTGDEFKCGEDYGIISAISFSKDGSQIVFGNGNGKIKMIYTIDGAINKKEIYEEKEQTPE